MSKETFVDLLAPNLQSIRRLVKARLRTSDQAEDIVQKTLLHAYTHRDQLRVQAKFKSWLWSIAINEIRAFLRSARPVVPLDPFLFELPDRQPSPFARYEQIERAQRLQAGMATLSNRDRTAIRLVDVEDLTVPQAARTLSVSTAALKSTHYRARQRLGRVLRGAV